jgi:RNA polymerase sigma-70 factor, ECF subfamily
MSRVVPSPNSGVDALRDTLRDLLLCNPLLWEPLLSTGVPAPREPCSTEYPPEIGFDADAARVATLVDRARDGDAEAFGLLYDHYEPPVYRFVFYRVLGQQLAEDIVSDTFVRALRSIASFRWQGKDFGAWLMTIARNLITDHYKSGQSRLETTTAEFAEEGAPAPGPEDEVLQGFTSDLLHEALQKLAPEQQECLLLRFVASQSITATAKSLGRTEGAVKQLQLRAIRNLAKLVPDGLR